MMGVGHMLMYVCVVVAAVVAVAALPVCGKETYYVSTATSIFAVDKSDGSSSTLPTGPLPPIVTIEGLKYGWTSIGVNPTNYKLYATQTNRQVVAFTQSADGGTFGVAVVAGKPGDITKQDTVADGVGSNAVLSAPFSIAFLPSGDMAVVDRRDHVLRKVALDGTVTSYGRPSPDVAPGAFKASGKLYEPIAVVVDSKDNMYVGSRLEIVKVTQDGTYTVLAGDRPSDDPANGAAPVDGALGTNRVFQVSGLALSADESKLYFPTQIRSGVSREVSSVLRELNLVTGVVTTLAGSSTHAKGSYSDGVGTNAVIQSISQMSRDSDGNIVFTELCTASSVVRKFNPTTKAVTRVSGDYTAAGCSAFGVPVSSLSNSVSGTADETRIVHGNGLAAVNVVCGRAFPMGVDIDLNGVACSSFDGGSVPKLEITTTKAEVAITQDLVVNGPVELGASSVLAVKAVLDIQGPLIMEDAVLEVSGASATADTLTMGSSGVYNILLDSSSPAKLNIRTDAAISGTIIVSIAPDYVFPVGGSASVLSFATHTGSFINVYFVKLYAGFSRAATRTLAQASSATVTCGSVSCTATGVALSADDDDEVGYIVALVVLSALLMALLVGAVIYQSKAHAAASTPLSAASYSYSFDSSSSDSYSFA